MERFSLLTWDDLNEWAGSKIVARGRDYQLQGRVSELAQLEDGALIAWVDGSDLYATKVSIDAAGVPESVCTCPYGVDCKHGVAALLEYLEGIKQNEPVPRAAGSDERLGLLASDGEVWDAETGGNQAAQSRSSRKAIDAFLNGKSKKQLIGLIHEIAGQYPQITQDLADRKQIASGNVKTMVTRLRQEIRAISSEPGWQNYWNGEGYTPDYSGVRNKLKVLVQAGHSGEVLILGKKLLGDGIRNVEESDDEGETAGEVAGCLPVIVKALDQSSLDGTGKLSWALDAVLDDDYGVCEVFVEYLHRRHPVSSWKTLADRLLERLRELQNTKGVNDSGGNSTGVNKPADMLRPSAGSANHNEVADHFSRYERDRLSDWAIYALEQSDRQDEIIPLCEAEARRTGSYLRLIERLLAERRHGDAEVWIEEGIKATRENWPGTAADLRHKLREIRVMEKNWPAVAAMLAEEFVRHPSRDTFSDCKKSAGKVKAWPAVRKCLLDYLAEGRLPGSQAAWPLPKLCPDTPEAESKKLFPMVDELIDIAILEKKPGQVLHWYDQYGEIAKNRLFWSRTSEDEIAVAVQSHAPDRAVAIWKKLAEALIAQVNVSAYQEAARYLRKAGSVMSRQKQKKQWDQYLQELKDKHARKRRLMEIMEELNGEPIAGKGAANA